MKKFLAAICAVLALTTTAGAVEVAAPSALLMEKETGAILYAKDEHAKLEPASVTKVMTILLTMEAVELRHHGDGLCPRLLHGRKSNLAERERADDGG